MLRIKKMLRMHIIIPLSKLKPRSVTWKFIWNFTPYKTAQTRNRWSSLIQRVEIPLNPMSGCSWMKLAWEPFTWHLLAWVSGSCKTDSINDFEAESSVPRGLLSCLWTSWCPCPRLRENWTTSYPNPTHDKDINLTYHTPRSYRLLTLP